MTPEPAAPPPQQAATATGSSHDAIAGVFRGCFRAHPINRILLEGTSQGGKALCGITEQHLVPVLMAVQPDVTTREAEEWLDVFQEFFESKALAGDPVREPHEFSRTVIGTLSELDGYVKACPRALPARANGWRALLRACLQRHVERGPEALAIGPLENWGEWLRRTQKAVQPVRAAKHWSQFPLPPASWTPGEPYRAPDISMDF